MSRLAGILVLGGLCAIGLANYNNASTTSTTTVAESKAATETTNYEASNDNAAGVITALGCGTKYSDERAADIFAQRYKNKIMTASGTLVTNDNGKLGLKLLRSTQTFDLRVTLNDKDQSYNLQNGQRVTVRFLMTGHGGCFLPFFGKDGVIVGVS
jgi:hypothetical protein